MVFNRDERYSRPEARPPEVETVDGVRVLAPRDPEGGGTWIAVNEFGLVCCLMNNYSPLFRHKSGGTPYRALQRASDGKFRSRGQLVRTVSTHSDLHNLRRMLAGVDFEQYRPFHLIVFPGLFAPVEWQWDGRELKEIVGPPPVLTTSGILPRHISKLRTRRFRKATNGFLKELSDEEQLALHRSRRPWPPAISVAMKWKNRGTVSLTQVKVQPDEVMMSYQPGDPATTVHPVKTYRLKRAGYPKPERKILPCEPYPHNPIDIIRLFREKNPEMHQKLPGAARTAIRLVAREKVINDRLNRVKEVPCNLFSVKVLNHIGVRGHLKPAAGPLPSPASRPVFLSNHPTGGLDGMLALHWLSTYYPDIHLIVNDLLWNLHHMRPYVVPIDVFGDSRKALKTLFEVFEGDLPLMVFPSGETARKRNGVLTEAPWQKNPIKMAIKHQRTVVPIHLDGYNSRLFYAIARARKLLRIPLNLEMMLLSHEFFFPKWKDFGITVGEPLTAGQVRSLGSNDGERAEALRRICMQLPKQHYAGV